MSDAEMWKRYIYKDFEVRVIQKWTDPFGTRMVRFADIADSERAMGVPEDVFTAEARPSPIQDDPASE